MKEKANLITIDDQKINIKDIRKTLPEEIHLIDEKQKNGFEDIFSEIFEVNPDGILIDINLNKYNFDELYCNGIEIQNGIDIAKMLFKFNNAIPIAIYTSYPEDYKQALKSLPENISVYTKTGENFDEILKEFYEEVQDFSFVRSDLTFEQFNTYNPSTKHIHYIKWAKEINPEIYFQIFEEQFWFIDCNGIIAFGKELDVDFNALRKTAIKRNAPLKYYSKINTPDDFRHCIEYNLPPSKNHHPTMEEMNKMNQIRLAYRLVDFYLQEEMEAGKVWEYLLKLNDLAIIEFQRDLILKTNNEDREAEELVELLAPFKEILFGNKPFMVDFFEARMGEIDEDEDTAWVTMHHIYDESIRMGETYSFSKLKDKGILAKGVQFHFIIYQDSLGSASVYTQPLA